MLKTLRISFELKNTYRVNTVLYYIKQIPLIGKHLPDSLYQMRWLKILAQIVAVLWELFTALSGKVLFLSLFVLLPTSFFEEVEGGRAFIHIFLLLTLVGAKANNYLVEGDTSAYYTISLLGMNARSYVLTNYSYQLLKLAVGYLIFGLIFGLLAGVPWWLCLLMVPFALGAKTTVEALQLCRYERTEDTEYHGVWQGLLVFAMGALIAAAYALPLFGIALSVWVSAVIMAAFVFAGVLAVKKLLTFEQYRAMHQQVYNRITTAQTEAVSEAYQTTKKQISDAGGITSSRRGFAYLNDLFVKRHRKILWKPAITTAAVVALVVAVISGGLFFIPELRQEFSLDIMGMLPCFPFILYLVNRGTAYTQALFMNCDHSLLTYSFYKQPQKILKLFQIRLLQIIKVNLLPGTVIALGLPLILFASGGTDNPWDYSILFVSIISMSIFFSVHYLTLYYLFQPYNAGSELKNGAYQFITGLTYVVCYMLLDLEVSSAAFGGLCIAFCLGYSVIACVLVYFLAPKTFRIRV